MRISGESGLWNLIRDIEDGNLSIDNNFAERAMHPIAIGLKNWLFVGSLRAGQRAAVLTSLMASCKNNLFEPWAYLKDVFERMAYQPTDAEITGLLPDVWLSANPTQRWEIANKRRQELEK